MKKKIGLLAAAALSAFAATNVSQSISQNTGTTIQPKEYQEQDNNSPKKQDGVANRKLISEHRSYKNSVPHIRYIKSGGVSPKEWGQYLQRTGKQKWNKKV